MPVKTCANVYPLSLIQEDIWLSQMIHNEIPLYNIGGNFKINGYIDVDIYIETQHRVIRQNDAFRMVFHKGEGLPSLSFSDTAREMVLKDFSHHADPDKAAMQWWQKEFCKPFEIYDAQLSRYFLLKTSEESFYYAMCAHHLTMDGYCFALLKQRLLENYNALINGSEEPGSQPSYVDFITNDLAYRSSDAFSQAKAYWSEKFETIPRPMISRRYAAGYGTTATPSAFSHIWFPPDFYDQLIKYSKQHQGNVFFLMAAVLYTYFLRTTDIKQFVFSIPLLNRPTPEFMETMGPFVNVVPVCLDFGLDIDIQAFFELLKTQLKESFPHQRFPLGEINRAINLKRSGRDQLFDVSLSYEKFNYSVMDYNGTGFEVNTMHNGWDQTPLSLAIKEYQKELGVKLEFYYNLAAYKPHEIEFLMERVRYMLQQLLNKPDIPLRQLSILPATESKKLLVEFNRQPQSLPGSCTTICQKLAEAVRTYPNHAAVQLGCQQISYHSINDRSDRLASYLRPLLQGPETIVGVFVDKSIEMVVGILSILKAGGAYVPLDPDYPQERIKFMIEDSGTSIILTLNKFASRLAGNKTASIIALDNFPYDDQAVEKSKVTVNASSLAYVIYTSGTTGQPKGVMCTHGGLVNLVAAQNKIFDITHDSRVLQFASLNFDASVSEIFTALSAGATLVLAEKDKLMPGPPLLSTLKNRKITHVTLPPSALAVMDPVPLPDLTTLITAGEPCPSRLLKKWGNGRRFINAYGPTETTVCASAWVCKDEDTDQLPIGQPIDNTSLYVLDKNLAPVPLGVPGQLYIGGAGVAKGYLNRPELTRERFIENPFKERTGHKRLYRTGDMVRFLTDSTLMFMGRFDHQVKIRGFRIEPEEVEKVIARHPEVSQIAVIPKTGPSSDRYLVAFFSSPKASTAQSLAVKIRQFAGQSLPDYMIPSQFIPMDEMPYTPSGKVDRRLLEGMDTQVGQSPNAGDLPGNDTEKKLMALFSKAMDGNSISLGAHDDFFESGMDSLAAVRFINLLERTFNHRLLFSEIMDNRTVHTLAKLLSGRTGPAHRQLIVPIAKGGTKPPFFCITAGYGDVVKLRQLSCHLGADQPFFMIQPNDNGTAMGVEPLAKQYAIQIFNQFPNGPYRLGGYSAGGLMAYETARLLKEQGKEVDFLVMIGAPYSYRRLARLMTKKVRFLVLHLLPDSEKKAASNILEILRAVFLDRGLQYHLEALVGYRPRGYKGRIDYFQGKWAISKFLGTHRTWRRHAKGPFEVHMLPGNHDSFMKAPHVATLADRLKQCLAGLDPKKGGYK
ncbi:non-ribosomal peptide synthetase [Desulfobacter curvatus]|uniref:non-ribosomal peptide synthetase n=1 Tax=Desulfobacter curvatus TaxID=2290 RepID=UPI00036CB8E0|nr:non-ribosomal peptide synthetase [Desulfobacter curvatus]